MTFETYQVGLSDIPLLDYNNIFVGNLAFIKRGVVNDIATYDLVIREMPKTRNFYVMNGLERFLDILLNYHFDKEAIKVMKAIGLIDSRAVETYYRKFKFTGDVYAMRDGTIFFPGSPIVRITAPLGEANILTAFMMNVFSYPIRVMAKNVRVKMACADRLFMGGTIVRLPGFEQGLWSVRDSYIAGSPAYVPMLHKKFPQVKPTGKIGANINHAFIKSFPGEREAYQFLFSELIYKADTFFIMIDTYEIKRGLQTFIEEAKKVKKWGDGVFMVTIDSGDIKSQSFWVRRELDKAGLRNIKIQVMSNLDEYKVDKMIKAGCPIDAFFCGTAVGNLIDNSALEAVYKMAELVHRDGTVELKAKLTKGKVSLPGRKQIFRTYKNGQMAGDVIGLENEKLGEPLLKKFVASGKFVGNHKEISDLMVIRRHLQNELSKLPEKYKNLNQRYDYPVRVSDSLNVLLDEVKSSHLKGH